MVAIISLVQKMKALLTQDAQGMTPLHCAAMFDHPQLVAHLMSEVRWQLSRLTFPSNGSTHFVSLSVPMQSLCL